MEEKELESIKRQAKHNLRYELEQEQVECYKVILYQKKNLDKAFSDFEENPEEFTKKCKRIGHPII